LRDGRDGIELNGLHFHRVEATEVVMGTTRGGWVYASQRPSYRARLPTFFVLNDPLSDAQVKRAFGLAGVDEDQAAWMTLTSVEVDELSAHLMASPAWQASEYNAGWEIRAPTEAEWRAALAAGVVRMHAGTTERLADAPATNYRGAMMDGRPRPNEWQGPAAMQRAALAVHPSRPNITALTSVPVDRPLPNVVARLVMAPIRTDAPRRVPETTDRWSNLRSEMLWTTVLGIVPSFTIPVLRGMGDYALEGWLNLLVGGLCAGFFTGAFWRPSRPVLDFDDVVPHSSLSDSQ
jgi:hypothetical protein